MFVKPDNWNELSVEERRKARLDHWCSGEGIDFVSAEAKRAYQERAQLLREAVELDKKPARVPVFIAVGVYAQRRLGLTPRSLFYDQWWEAARANTQFCLDLQPDASPFLLMFSGKAFELLDYKVMKWPDHGVAPEQSYQFVECEFMKEDEYPLLLSDPSDFILRRALPRMCGSLGALQKLPKFALGYGFVDSLLLPFALPEVQEALEVMKEAATHLLGVMQTMVAAVQDPPRHGFPQLWGPLAVAPFDAIGDTLRSTRGIMIDMYRRPDELIAACEKYVPLMIESTLAQPSDSPFVFIPLHKGADRFMSVEQFEKFYWPSLKAVMLALIEDGFIPTPFAEGSYNQRLEFIAELPKGASLWHFDQTDMKRAAEVLGDVCCIMGNVPASLTATGTPDQMRAYCRNLIETCAQDGNFILTNGCQVDEAREENLHAMVAVAREYCY
ncbi:MAG: uroporphyrinogen decarboxylase [Anaerolineae bacterium]|nr:uroporphyrinogen decarboxylase [Anaerolineae bacterium]